MKHWVAADGRKMAYREAGSGPPLVLVHGWAMSSAIFTEALPALSDQFRVLAPDLPGHGHSTPGADYRLDTLAGALLAWMQDLDLQHVRLLGWSLGGQIALRLAALEETRLSRLLLVATTPRFIADATWSDGQSEAQVAIMARGLKRRFGGTLAHFFAQMFVAEELSEARRRFLQRQFGPDAAPPLQESALAVLETLRCSDLRSQLQTLSLATLVMHGTEDLIIPQGAGRYLAEQLPQARLVSLAGLGHAPFLSRPPECFSLWREFCHP
jgi:pimeloyl-[acyl-carrier protein] methyl ester esterase